MELYAPYTPSAYARILYAYLLPFVTLVSVKEHPFAAFTDLYFFQEPFPDLRYMIYFSAPVVFFHFSRIPVSVFVTEEITVAVGAIVIVLLTLPV